MLCCSGTHPAGNMGNLGMFSGYLQPLHPLHNGFFSTTTLCTFLAKVHINQLVNLVQYPSLVTKTCIFGISNPGTSTSQKTYRGINPHLFSFPASSILLPGHCRSEPFHYIERHGHACAARGSQPMVPRPTSRFPPGFAIRCDCNARGASVGGELQWFPCAYMGKRALGAAFLQLHLVLLLLLLPCSIRRCPGGLPRKDAFLRGAAERARPNATKAANEHPMNSFGVKKFD